MKRGKIIMICGLPGSGKTTLSKKLAEKRKTVRLCPDEWIIKLGSSDRYTDAKHRGIIESIQWDLALSLTRQGLNVVLENGYWTKQDRLNYAKSAKSQNLKTELHFLDIPLEELKTRIQKRNKSLPKFSLKVSAKELEHWFSKFETPTLEELKNNYSSYKIYKC